MLSRHMDLYFVDTQLSILVTTHISLLHGSTVDTYIIIIMSFIAIVVVQVSNSVWYVPLYIVICYSYYLQFSFGFHESYYRVRRYIAL